MGKYIYNDVMNRWMNNYEYDEYMSSAAFREGYDDPTYMTFKIEFGDWGASILDRSEIRLGTTVFTAEKNDYDALPIGLLNCPYPGINDGDSYWQNDANNNSINFNDINDYSAFRYLRSRNEDTRAKYLYYFVNGLFEIQHNTPYIFKKITGLNALEKFDPKKGQRLTADTKITVECYEGLNLKIRTLMEFYRKAAWDDVYQKWILPENMRQFKMIIYVFERRIFQEMGTFSDENMQRTIMKYSGLNKNIPVKAYECCPCEFDISGSMSWNDTYSANTENSEETSKLVINIKNVKTYYKNGLLNDKLSNIYDSNETQSIHGKISNLMIYDLVEGIERSNSNYQSPGNAEITSDINNMTVNGVRAMFLNKDILLENEDAGEAVRHYLWGNSPSGPFSVNQYMNQDTLIKDLLEKSNNLLTGYSMNAQYRSNGVVSSAIEDSLMDMTNLESRKYASAAIEDPIMSMTNLFDLYPRAGWISVLVNQPTYDTSKSFWNNLCDAASEIMYGARRQVLLSGCNFSLTMDSWDSIINCLYYDGYASTAIDVPGDIMSLSKGRIRKSPLIQPAIYENSLTHNSMEEMDLLREVPTQNMEEMDPLREVPEYNMEEMEPLREIPSQNMEEMNPLREVPLQNMEQMDPLREIPNQPIEEMNPLREIPEYDMEEMDPLREVPDQTMEEMDPLRELPDQTMEEMNPLREVPDQTMEGMDPLREIPNQQMKEMGSLRNIPEQNYNTLTAPKNIDNKEIENLMAQVRALPGFKNVSLDNLREIPVQEMQKLVEMTNKTKPEYKISNMEVIETISKAIENTEMKIKNLDADNIEQEKAIFDTLKMQFDNFKLLDITDNDDDDTKKKKSIANFAKLLSDNQMQIKDAIADNIIKMKNTLLNLSKEAVRDLPKINMYTIKNSVPNDKNDIKMNDMSAASINDIHQLNHNIQILSLSNAEIKELSLTTLINLNKEMESRIRQTNEMQGLSQLVKKTDDENEQKKILQLNQTQKKSKNREMLGLLPPREVNRNQIIY
ncbi:MAG: hypothetical protein [Wendovervirus sonii]|uniref:Portal protein n=1 Tax=phage Lak_Megaphage_Sonny TaxID=3109229 RepID=A0ABZ0Z2T7_9CAUD|nr:MAG: hypothetical protein [phage Lak_Megaphage_Sonny]